MPKEKGSAKGKMDEMNAARTTKAYKEAPKANAEGDKLPEEGD